MVFHWWSSPAKSIIARETVIIHTAGGENLLFEYIVPGKFTIHNALERIFLNNQAFCKKKSFLSPKDEIFNS